MSKILVIPDIHCRNFWRRLIDEYVHLVDKIIFLGDYLDPYIKEINEYPLTMEVKDFYDYEGALKMLNDIISLKKDNPDKYILLCGNHVSGYIWRNFESATRRDPLHWENYHNFFLENLNLFNLVWIKNNVIFSHAGISEEWAYEFLANYMKYDESTLETSLVRETAEVLKDTLLKDFNENYINGISNISYYRGGSFSYGSCEWADIREHIDHHKTEIEEKIIPLGENGIYQVFGHTQLLNPLITDKWACLDCRRGFIIDSNTYEITES